tara:strand:- start:235 stop:507 length:273 start_codon:yes stop_codon:yes gene_type:complete
MAKKEFYKVRIRAHRDNCLVPTDVHIVLAPSAGIAAEMAAFRAGVTMDRVGSVSFHVTAEDHAAYSDVVDAMTLADYNKVAAKDQTIYGQ